MSDKPGDEPHHHHDPTSVEAQLQSIRQQLALLQMQIKEYQQESRTFQQQVRFRDILGGIGWILGLGGIAIYFLTRRRKDTDTVDR